MEDGAVDCGYCKAILPHHPRFGLLSLTTRSYEATKWVSWAMPPLRKRLLRNQPTPLFRTRLWAFSSDNYCFGEGWTAGLCSIGRIYVHNQGLVARIPWGMGKIVGARMRLEGNASGEREFQAIGLVRMYSHTLPATPGTPCFAGLRFKPSSTIALSLLEKIHTQDQSKKIYQLRSCIMRKQ